LVNVSYYYKKNILIERIFLSIEQCEDYVADQSDCTKFLRCFENIRIRFTCPSGTAWEEQVKRCVRKEQVQGCQQVKQQRKLGNYSLFFWITNI